MISDVQIQRSVIEALEREPAVNSLHIGVEVQGGIVTLSGHVGSYAEKLHAQAAALQVDGVDALAIGIKVRLPGLDKRTDADIARSVNEVLGWRLDLPHSAVRVVVESGWVTLIGDVERTGQRRLAKEVIQRLLGVIGVGDQTVTKASDDLGASRSMIKYG